MNPLKRKAARRSAHVLAAVILVASSALLAGCGGGGDAAGSGTAGTLTFGMSQAPNSLNPANAVFDNMRSITSDPILTLQTDGTVAEGLATEWGYVGEGNTVFEFNLRDGVKFSDGEALDSAAVKGWFEYFPTGRSSYAAMMGEIAAIETPDPSTVRITLAQANPLVPLLLTNSFGWGSVQSPAAVAAPEKLETETYGTGPYVLDTEQTVVGDRYTFVPNEYYWDTERIHWDKIVTRVIANPSSRLQAVQTGEIQGASGEPTTLAAAEDAGLQVFPISAAQQSFLIADADGKTVEALGDVRVRQALNYAIDRETLTKAIYPEGGTPTTQFATFDGTTDAAEGKYPYDVAKAKSLLAEAGYADGFEVEVRSLDFTGPDFQNIMQAVAEYWSEIGVTVKITPSNNLDQYMTGLGSGASIIQAAPQYNFPMAVAYPLYMAPGGNFHPGDWTDETLAKLYDEGRVAADPTAIWQQMTERITDQAYTVPIMAPPSGIYVSKDIEGVEVSNASYIPVLPDWAPAGD